MAPKLGFKTLKMFYDKEDRIEFDTLELITKDPHMRFYSKRAAFIKEALKGKELSFHSETGRLFQGDEEETPELLEMEINAIRAEILFAKHIGAKEFIFHIKDKKLTKVEERTLRELLDFADKNKVDMIYESNPSFSAEICIDTLKRFPDLKYNLDLGHLNTALVQDTLGMPLEEFISKVKERTVYVHAHNNDGLSDTHIALDKGTLDWKKVLNLLDLSKIRKIIMEVRNTADIQQTKKLLEAYLAKKGEEDIPVGEEIVIEATE